MPAMSIFLLGWLCLQAQLLFAKEVGLYLWIGRIDEDSSFLGRVFFDIDKAFRSLTKEVDDKSQFHQPQKIQRQYFQENRRMRQKALDNDLLELALMALPHHISAYLINNELRSREYIYAENH